MNTYSKSSSEDIVSPTMLQWSAEPIHPRVGRLGLSLYFFHHFYNFYALSMRSIWKFGIEGFPSIPPLFNQTTWGIGTLLPLLSPLHPSYISFLLLNLGLSHKELSDTSLLTLLLLPSVVLDFSHILIPFNAAACLVTGCVVSIWYHLWCSTRLNLT